MGWLDHLRDKLVAIDSAPLIYFIEENPNYLSTLVPFFELVDSGAVQCVTSVVTLAEVLVLPLRHGNSDLAAKYREILLDSGGISTFGLTERLAEQAAAIRAAYNLRTPDAFQLATALDTGATAILTNDASFQRFPGLPVLLLDELVTTG